MRVSARTTMLADTVRLHATRVVLVIGVDEFTIFITYLVERASLVFSRLRLV